MGASRPQGGSRSRAALIVILSALLLAAATMTGAAALPGADEDGVWVPTLPLKEYGSTQLSSFADGTGFVLQHSNDALSFFKTQDHGQTWAPLESPVGGSPARMHFGSPTHGIAFGNGSLMRTTDGAASWDPVALPWKSSAANVDLVRMTDGGKTMVVVATPWMDGSGAPWTGGTCHDMRRDKLHLFVSSDGGRNWRSKVLAAPATIASDIDFLDKDHGIISIGEIVGEIEETGECAFRRHERIGSKILVTHNGGHSWKKVFDCATTENCLAVALPSPRRIVIGATSGRILTSRDGGRYFIESWLDGVAELPSEQRDTYRWIQDIDFASPLVGYVLTNGRGVWRTTDGGVEIWVRETSPMDAPGVAVQGAGGQISAADKDNALAGGPTYIIRRVVTP